MSRQYACDLIITSVNRKKILADVDKQYSLFPPYACLDKNV